MYSLPSASHMREPSPRTMNGGSPPTARKARTGEFTPPGIKASARFCNLRDSSKERMGQADGTVKYSRRRLVAARRARDGQFSFLLISRARRTQQVRKAIITCL